MKKSLYFMLIIFISSFNVIAQDKIDVMRYEYEVMFKPSVKDADSVYTEKMYLDVWANQSRFSSESKSKLIEFLAEEKNSMFRGEMFFPPGVAATRLDWTVIREGQKVYVVSKVGASLMKMESSLKEIKWDILPEIEEYEGMKVQKAIGELRGRIWTVWFTTEIDLIEGPYKFKNLPGFVVKAVDDKADYLFEFRKSEKVQTVSRYFGYEDAMLVDAKRMLKAREIASNKTRKQVLSERGITIHVEPNSESEANLNSRVGDDTNHIEKL
ncbi:MULTISPECIES: GLPGLI family protein [Myroides]|uniref:GLPGLI family protein n=1 Tax=Myroides TaxID=76831 RepID=UPI001303228C|nr:GLPGLI family protein [Myroides phaeus]